MVVFWLSSFEQLFEGRRGSFDQERSLNEDINESRFWDVFGILLIIFLCGASCQFWCFCFLSFKIFKYQILQLK